MTTAPKLPEGLEPEGYFTTTDDGRWVEAPEGADRARLTPLFGQAALQAQAAEKDAEIAALKEDAARYRWLRMNRLWLKANLPGIAAPLFDAAIDSALALAAKEAKQ